jgi:hypothetical protein
MILKILKKNYTIFKYQFGSLYNGKIKVALGSSLPARNAGILGWGWQSSEKNILIREFIIVIIFM